MAMTGIEGFSGGTRLLRLLELLEQPQWFNFPARPFGDQAEATNRSHDVTSGNPTLFQRAEFAEEGWRDGAVFTGRLERAPKQCFPNYAAGSSGPTSVNVLLSVARHRWNSLEES